MVKQQERPPEPISDRGGCAITICTLAIPGPSSLILHSFLPKGPFLGLLPHLANTPTQLPTCPPPATKLEILPTLPSHTRQPHHALERIASRKQVEKERETLCTSWCRSTAA